MKSRDRFGLVRTAAAILLLCALVFTLAGHHHPLFASHGSDERMSAGTGVVDCLACTLERSGTIAVDAEAVQVDLDSAPLRSVTVFAFPSHACDALSSRAPPLA